MNNVKYLPVIAALMAFSTPGFAQQTGDRITEDECLEAEGRLETRDDGQVICYLTAAQANAAGLGTAGAGAAGAAALGLGAVTPAVAALGALAALSVAVVISDGGDDDSTTTTTTTTN